MVVREFAAWAVDMFKSSHLPIDVDELACAQRLSIFGALAATRYVGEGHRPSCSALIGDADAQDGLFRAVDDAAMFDFDDYICFGHAGLSSVLTASAVSSAVGTSTHDESVRAQVVANELHARIAGACLLGPHGPVQWSYAHSVSAAAAAGLLLRLSERELGHAIAISLSAPTVPAVASFIGPDTRSLVVANATVLGLRAAMAAAEGRTGPIRILESEHGVLRGLVRRPMTRMLSGLGTGWALRTLSVKTRPTCSYVDPVLDALEDLGLGAEDIEAIDVAVPFPTATMTRIADRHAEEWSRSPSVLAFSVPLSSALLLTRGQLTPADVTWFSSSSPQDHGEIIGLARCIRVRHHPRLSLRTVRSLAPMIPASALPVPKLLRAILPARRNAQPWSSEATARYEMRFPVVVSVRQRTGPPQVKTVDIARGAAGSTVAPGSAAQRKFAAWAPGAWGMGCAKQLEESLRSEAQKAWDRVPHNAGTQPV